MQQDLVSISIPKDQQAAILALIAQINQQLPGLITFSPGERRSYPMLGPKSERYARGIITSLQQNPDIVPRGINVEA